MFLRSDHRLKIPAEYSRRREPLRGKIADRGVQARPLTRVWMRPVTLTVLNECRDWPCSMRGRVRRLVLIAKSCLRGCCLRRRTVGTDAHAIPGLPVEVGRQFLRVVAELPQTIDHLVGATFIHHGFDLNVVWPARRRRRSYGGGRRRFSIGIFVVGAARRIRIRCWRRCGRSHAGDCCRRCARRGRHRSNRWRGWFVRHRRWWRHLGHGRRFRFVGPTTAYALMQACGLVNDHLERCAVRDTVEAERRPPG